MLDLIIFSIMSFSMTQILVKEYIFKWFRKIFNFKPFTCIYCMSVWIGFLNSFIFTFNDCIYINIFIGGMISYFSTRIITIYIDKNEFSIDE